MCTSAAITTFGGARVSRQSSYAKSAVQSALWLNTSQHTSVHCHIEAHIFHSHIQKRLRSCLLKNNLITHLCLYRVCANYCLAVPPPQRLFVFMFSTIDVNLSLTFSTTKPIETCVWRSADKWSTNWLVHLLCVGCACVVSILVCLTSVLSIPKSIYVICIFLGALV